MLLQELDFLQALTTECKNTTSTIAKREILEKYNEQNSDYFDKWMDLVCSFDKKFWLTSENVQKMQGKFKQKFTFKKTDSIFTILNKLVDRTYTGHEALNYVQDLIKFIPDKYHQLLLNVIDKDLKCNVSTSLINKVKPDTVKTFSVALAQRNDEAPDSKQPNFETGAWHVSQKLDGVRCVAFLVNGEPVFYSRQGNEFTTLNNLKESVKEVLQQAKIKYGEEFVLDGECCIIKNNKEDFSAIMKEITRKDYTIQNPCYVLFDLISKKEFDNENGLVKFNERFKRLSSLSLPENTLKLVPHQFNVKQDDLIKWQQKVKDNDWEGLMLRDGNSVYQGKRSFDLQKLKSFHDAEFKVVGIEKGTKKMLVNGKMQEKECVAALQIKFKGNNVGVGSGLSDEERIQWLKHPEDIIGKEVTIQYFEETIDSKTNKPSLRFPTLKVVYKEKGREI